MNKQAFLILVDRWLSGAATAEEEELLINYYNSFQDNHEWNEAELGSKEIIAGRILNNLQSQTTQLNPFDRRSEAKAVVHRIPFLKTTWFKYAAAILIMAGIGAYLWNTNQKEPVKGTLPAEASIAKVDVSPGFNRATLTLSDGKQVILDSAASETINDGTLPIKNKDGQLLYGSLSSPFEKGGSGDQRGNADRRGISQYNTMSTPKGGQYRLTLSDGTRVWLNAASSITYPTAFTNKTREVSISGEAYFEVTPIKSQPFIVKTNKEQITVLGTEFNVNTYPDEISKTSLISGSVRVGAYILRPGFAFTNNKIIKTNIDQDIAWKNGYFNFEGADIQSVMRQLSRWYDIDIKYTGKIKEGKFRGELPRSLNLSEVLEILHDVNIKYRIQGKTLFIE